MPMPHRLPPILLLELPAVAGFFPLTPDPKQQVIYNSAKVLAKVTTQKKHIIQVIQDWRDFATICNNFANCKSEEEMTKAWVELGLQVGAATWTTPETPKDIAELTGAAFTATQKLAEYEARAAMLKAAADKTPFFPPEIKEFIDELIKQRQRPETLSLTLRLRGPKSNATAINILNKPPSEKAIDRWWNFGGLNNSTNVNNINRGGGQINHNVSQILQPENLDFTTLSSQNELDQILSLHGGHQPTIGVNVEEFNDFSMIDKFASLIIRNHRKILLCTFVGGICYLIFKKRRGLKRFCVSFQKLFRKGYFLYKRITSNRIINNPVTRRIWIFSLSLNRLRV